MEGSTVMSDKHHGHLDLTKREFFAAMAMKGLCASGKLSIGAYMTTASTAVKQADALMRELEKEIEKEEYPEPKHKHHHHHGK